MERLEHLGTQEQVVGFRTGTIKSALRYVTDRKAFESRMSPGFLAWIRWEKKKAVLKYECLCMIYTVLAGVSHEKNDCTAFFMFLDGNRGVAAVCAPAQCCRGNFFCLISQQNTLACTREPWNDFAVPKTLPHSNSNKETTEKYSLRGH